MEFITDVTIMDTPSMNDQYCIVPKGLNLQIGDQVRILVGTALAIYTVKSYQEDTNMIITLNGKDRLHLTSHIVSGIVQGPSVVCPKPLTDAEAKAQSEFIERMYDDGGDNYHGFLCIAPHGGHIDLKTDFQAERVHQALPRTSLWMCKGYKSGGGAFQQWHTSSNDISPNSFPALKRIMEPKRKFTTCVAFHGMAEGGVLIGGLAPLELKRQVQQAIMERINDPTIAVRFSTKHDCCNGLAPNNCVNWLTKDGSGGIQIEQDRTVRKKYWMNVADAVIDVFAPVYGGTDDKFSKRILNSNTKKSLQ